MEETKVVVIHDVAVEVEKDSQVHQTMLDELDCGKGDDEDE